MTPRGSAPERGLAPSVAELADRLIEVVAAGELDALRALYTPDAGIWLNVDGRVRTVDENLSTLAWLHERVRNIRYDEVRRVPTADGYVQQHVLRAVTIDGTSLEVPACLVVTMRDGRVARLDEYLDSRALGALFGTG